MPPSRNGRERAPPAVPDCRTGQDEVGHGLRLKTVGHNLAPDLLDQHRRSAIGPILQPIEDLHLTLRPNLQVAIAFGILARRNIGGRR
nr:hypothetical protein [Sphingomonas daechungensis]